MTNILIIVLIVIGLLVGITAIRDGTNEVKENPIMSTVDSGKIVFDVGKDIVQGISGSESFDSNSSLRELGQIPCSTDEDCDILTECEGETCLCVEGSCFVEE